MRPMVMRCAIVTTAKIVAGRYYVLDHAGRVIGAIARVGNVWLAAIRDGNRFAVVYRMSSMFQALASFRAINRSTAIPSPVYLRF